MNRQKGFTLVEAAIAIGVVAILSGIIIPLVLKSLRDARRARARNDLNIIAGAIAHQLKDTGTRPRANGGDGGAAPTGMTNAMWFSGGQQPLDDIVAMAGADAYPAGGIGNQTFINLFTLASNNPIGNALFGYAARDPGDEFGYQGPYLSEDIASRTDPWGSAYVILGYNADGAKSGGPIWVVCAGESRTITNLNLTRAAGIAGLPAAYNPTWNYAGLSATNLAVRVN